MPATLSLPLLQDRHTHPMLYAAFMDGVSLYDASIRTTVDALARIHAAMEANPESLTLVSGWNSGRYPLPPEAFAGRSPVAVLNWSLHGLIINEAARELLQAHDAEAIARLEDDDWRERNLRRVLNLFASTGATVERLQRFYQRLLIEQGVYFAEEMLLVGARELSLMAEAGLTGRTRYWASPDVYETLTPTEQAQIHGIKLFTDGALGVRTAALHVPYRDAPQRGLLLYEDAELRSLVQQYAGRGHRMAIHAIGDRAIDQVVRIAAAVQPAPGLLRIEHAQLISLRTARMAKELGISLCMQPNFSDDSAHYADRLPEGYAARNNPFRMLIDEVGFTPGNDLVFGSDGMPHGVQEGLRQSLFPPVPGQVLTVDEFQAAYCLADPSQGQITVTIDAGTVCLMSTT